MREWTTCGGTRLGRPCSGFCRLDANLELFFYGRRVGRVRAVASRQSWEGCQRNHALPALLGPSHPRLARLGAGAAFLACSGPQAAAAPASSVALARSRGRARLRHASGAIQGHLQAHLGCRPVRAVQRDRFKLDFGGLRARRVTARRSSAAQGILAASRAGELRGCPWVAGRGFCPMAPTRSGSAWMVVMGTTAWGCTILEAIKTVFCASRPSVWSRQHGAGSPCASWEDRSCPPVRRSGRPLEWSGMTAYTYSPSTGRCTLRSVGTGRILPCSSVQAQLEARASRLWTCRGSICCSADHVWGGNRVCVWQLDFVQHRTW